VLRTPRSSMSVSSVEMPSACRVSAARRRLASRVSGKACVDARPEQSVAAGQVTGAGDDGHLRRVRADHRRGANGGVLVVDRQDHQVDALQRSGGEQFRVTDIAVEHRMTLAAPLGDQGGIGVEGDEGMPLLARMVPTVWPTRP
jgi:hypothetical protein